MNTFVTSVETNQKYGTTFNNAKTLKTSSNPLVDFYFAAGNRNVELSKQFDLAADVDKKFAFRIALWARDVRGGAGERATFRNLLKHFEKHYEADLLKMLPHIPEYGRWDDLLCLTAINVRNAAFAEIKKALSAENGLCAKWMPRKGKDAVELRNYLGLSPKQYRKMLTRMTRVVESQMCAKQWDEIKFDHVPSLASARYQKAFSRHCGQSYKDYRDGLSKIDPETGKTVRKINAGAVYPYDVMKSIDNGDRDVAKAQWNALPDLLGDDKILPMVDVSGSMMSWSYCYYQRGPKEKVSFPSVSPMQIAVSLGLYVASKQKGDFSGMFMTFESSPKIQKLTGDIVSMKNQMETSNWGGSTDLQAAFDEILNVAKKNKVSQEDMPKILLILSDMEFNSCTRDVTNYQAMTQKYEDAGYSLPKVVFWALNGRTGNVPVEFNAKGTALVSGFSPSLFKAILKNDLDDFSPEGVMKECLNIPRYDVPGLTI